MVSRVVLQQIHSRLREWRHSMGDKEVILAGDRNNPRESLRVLEPFGNIAVILAGDFGQLPPVAVQPSFSLLNTSVLRDVREQKSANQGLRLFKSFDTVVRLRRIHRQPGASLYKESLIRTRDGAMTKEDHALWKEHDLTDVDNCKLTTEERDAFNKLPHLFA